MLEWCLSWFQKSSIFFTHCSAWCRTWHSTGVTCKSSLCVVTLLWKLREFNNMKRCWSMPDDLHASEWLYLIKLILLRLNSRLYLCFVLQTDLNQATPKNTEPSPCWYYISLCRGIWNDITNSKWFSIDSKLRHLPEKNKDHPSRFLRVVISMLSYTGNDCFIHLYAVSKIGTDTDVSPCYLLSRSCHLLSAASCCPSTNT